MRAMILQETRQPLRLTDLASPTPGVGQVLVKVSACAVCRTDLHVVDGGLPNPKLPLVPGHEIVGRVAALGEGVTRFKAGERVGIPWLGWTCGECHFCRSQRENLCDAARFTGYTLDGGYAEYTVADARFCFRIPEAYSDAEAAPLLCAGLIGYRSLVRAGDARRLGIYGFWRGGAYRRAGRTASRARGVRLHPAWRRGGAAVCQITRCGLGRGLDFAAAGTTRCSHHLRACRSTSATGTPRRDQRRHRRLRGHSHERHSVVSLQHSLGGADRLLRGESDTPGWRGVSCARAACAGEDGN